ncbi:MAG: hypothetical protein ACXVAP_00295 [Candidatus Limnocylindrales bacterium]
MRASPRAAREVTVVRRIAAGVAAGLLVLVMAPGVLADTFGSPDGNLTTADAPFVQTVHGQQYQWDVFGQRDALAGVTTVGASYFAAKPITCRDGTPGEIDTSWNGETTGAFLATSNLTGAVAAARVTGTEATFNLCTFAETDKTKTFTVALALVGSSRLSRFVDQQACIDFGDGNGPVDLTSTTTSRNAVGKAFVDGHAFASTGGDIAHQVWSSVPDPACPPST